MPTWLMSSQRCCSNLLFSNLVPPKLPHSLLPRSPYLLTFCFFALPLQQVTRVNTLLHREINYKIFAFHSDLLHKKCLCFYFKYSCLISLLGFTIRYSGEIGPIQTKEPQKCKNLRVSSNALSPGCCDLLRNCFRLLSLQISLRSWVVPKSGQIRRTNSL
jgi:hypothetical protein